jgi:hypothetical protein
LFIARSLAPGNQQLQDSLRIPYTLHRKMNQGNADPGTLGNDFGLFGMVLWGALHARYPAHTTGWNQKLAALNTARNGIAHDDSAKITRVQSDGWPLIPVLLRSVSHSTHGAIGKFTLRIREVPHAWRPSFPDNRVFPVNAGTRAQAGRPRAARPSTLGRARPVKRARAVWPSAACRQH